jgi:hypothetical protein
MQLAPKRNTASQKAFDRATPFDPKLMIIRFATVIGITAGCGLSGKQIPSRNKRGASKR